MMYIVLNNFFMPEWFHDLFTKTSIAQSVIIYGLVIAIGIWMGRIKIAGISLGITWVLFAGLIFSYFGVEIDSGTEHFMKEFGLILFVYSIVFAMPLWPTLLRK